MTSRPFTRAYQIIWLRGPFAPSLSGRFSGALRWLSQSPPEVGWHFPHAANRDSGPSPGPVQMSTVARAPAVVDCLLAEVSSTQPEWRSTPASMPQTPALSELVIELARLRRSADVAELADAGDLKSSGPRAVWVRVPPSAPRASGDRSGRAGFLRGELRELRLSRAG